MPTKRQIELCLLNKITVHEFLLSLNISRSRVKKFKLKENFLNSSPQEICLPIDLLNDLQINPNFYRIDCYIIKETDDYLIIHKPPNLHSHPLNYGEWDNCLSYVRKSGKISVLSINQSNYDRGLLYRLDFGTSGLLIFSKRENLIYNFREAPKKKYYLAIVEGKLDADFHFKHSIDFHGKKKRKARAISSEAPNCQIKGRLLSFNEKRQLSLVEIELFEGLRHQIRVQLAAEGFPIYGDVLYGGKNAERIFLHAWKYRFEIGGENYIFEDRDFTLSDSYFSLENYLSH